MARASAAVRISDPPSHRTMPSHDMDADLRPTSREEGSILTENTDDFIIGDRVWVHGTKPGYIQYLGETRFGGGEWAGVVLDDASGKNDGSVAGVKYFQCEPGRGVFSRLHKLTRYPMLHLMPPAQAKAATLCPSHSQPPIQRCLTPTRTPSPGSRALREGDRVTVGSSGVGGGPPKTGVLRFLGQTAFAAGEWAGLELDEPLGKNDGTVAGKRYFRCLPNFGLFSPSHKVTRITGSLDRHRRNHHSGGSDRSSTNGHSSSQNIQGGPFSEDSEKRASRLRQLLETAEAERRQLAQQLEEERKKVEELEFRIEEECIGKDDLEEDREKERTRIEDLQRRLQHEEKKNERIQKGDAPEIILKDETKRLDEETKSLREKLRVAETKIKDLQNVKPVSPAPPPAALRCSEGEMRKKEESLLQAQLSLDNKKREVQNLLHRMQELEKELEKSKARQSRQLDAIDDLNVKLQKHETKCANLEEELHSTKEISKETERRLHSSSEQTTLLEAEKCRLQEQLLSPDATPKEQQVMQTLKDREREVCEWRKEAEVSRREADLLRSDREKQRREQEVKIAALQEVHREESRKEKKRAAETEERGSSRIKQLEQQLSSLQAEVQEAKGGAEARLARQEARLQESELRAEDAGRLRDQIARLTAERDLLRVEKEETWKRLQTSEAARQRWESEAHRASQEVDLLKSQVGHLRNEFTSYRDDLVRKLAETEFDTRAVQDLHLQIEEQRRVVEEMQHRLRFAEGERDQLQDKLQDRHQGHIQVENGLRQEVDTLQRRLSGMESEKQGLQRSLEASQLVLEEKRAKQQQHMVQNFDKVEGERSNLEKKVVDLQVELAAVKNGKVVPDLSREGLKSEKEALEQQVQFMSSVIVDMQTKNDDLRSRLDILETEVIFDGHLQLGMPPMRSARVFCDMCDAFDLHHTEDCPKQGSTFGRTFSHSLSQESEF